MWRGAHQQEIRHVGPQWAKPRIFTRFIPELLPTASVRVNSCITWKKARNLATVTRRWTTGLRTSISTGQIQRELDYFNVSFFFRVILGLTNRSPQILRQQYDHGYYRQIDKVLQPKPRMDMYFNGTFTGPHDIALVRLAGRDVVFIPGKIVPVRSKCMCTLFFFI